jgi:hypothetical protein
MTPASAQTLTSRPHAQSKQRTRSARHLTCSVSAELRSTQRSNEVTSTKCVKFGKKTLFYAADLASFLTRLRRLTEAEADSLVHAPGTSKNFERS